MSPPNFTICCVKLLQNFGGFNPVFCTQTAEAEAIVRYGDFGPDFTPLPILPHPDFGAPSSPLLVFQRKSKHQIRKTNPLITGAKTV